MTARKRNQRGRVLAWAIAALALFTLTFCSNTEEPTTRVIVQGSDAAVVTDLVRSVGSA